MIIPNNNFVLSEAPEVSVQNNIFANSEDYLRICQSFTDNFLNKINRTEDISLDYIQAKDPLTLVSNAVITKDSKVCFDVARLAP
ncbi:MAG: hypothetical protein LBQ24_03325 [Candidatus Peribacteria bacterium]|nr:hypothetical protein [Candidatus Peribacteria bacterium]